MSYIKLEDHGTMEVTRVSDHGYGAVIEADGMDFYIFPSADDAGKAAHEYWGDMAQDDPSEFVCMVGNECLIAWGLGQYAGPGTQVQSLQEWLDLWLDTPEEQWAGYDGVELEILRIGHLALELGWINDATDVEHLVAVAYRT